MGFTTTIKKKVEKTEKYPEVPVMTQKAVGGELKENTVFELNSEAMKLFGFEMNKANVNKISIGYNDNQDIALAAIDLKSIYTNNITAKNTFSNKVLLNRLVKSFDIDQSVDNEFVLLFDEPQADGPIVACMALILPDNGEFNFNDSDAETASIEAEESESDNVVEMFPEEVIEATQEVIPAPSLDDMPESVIDLRQAAFDSQAVSTPTSPHVIRVGVPIDAIAEQSTNTPEKEDW